jgi:hypothetical protein
VISAARDHSGSMAVPFALRTLKNLS